MSYLVQSKRDDIIVCNSLLVDIYQVPYTSKYMNKMVGRHTRFKQMCAHKTAVYIVFEEHAAERKTSAASTILRRRAAAVAAAAVGVLLLLLYCCCRGAVIVLLL